LVCAVERKMTEATGRSMEEWGGFKWSGEIDGETVRTAAARCLRKEETRERDPVGEEEREWSGVVCWGCGLRRGGGGFSLGIGRCTTAPDLDWGREQTEAAPSPDQEGSSAAVREAGRGAEWR
jgi:hypothetical protein